jgi:hypothetical protein
VTSRILAALLGAALVVTACSSDPEPKAEAPPETSVSPTPTPTPTPTLPSLLSGRMGKPNGPVLAVKIDNTRPAHPQVGLRVADVVYVEQVEGGLTRLAAVYSSELPKRVGPVRSARSTDIELLRQYGTVALAYAGAQRGVQRLLRRSSLKLLSFNDGRGFSRSPERPGPYDVIGDTAQLMRRAGNVDSPKAVGYEFGDAPAGGRPAARFEARFPSAQIGGAWSAKRKQWLLSMDGRKDMAAEGGQLGANTFVVQFVTIRPSRFRDVNGANSPHTTTVGSGRAMIFRDGQVYEGRWSRAKASDPTAYTIDGQPAVFAPGTIWVALLGRERPVRVS